MMATKIFTGLCLVACAAAMPSRVHIDAPTAAKAFSVAGATVAEATVVSAPVFANGWATTTPTKGDVSFTVSVQQQNMDLIKQIALEVSDPRNVKYGQHLKQAEIDALCAPKPADMAAVNAWLNEYNVKATAIGTHLVNVVCPVAVAEKMLATTYHRLENANTHQAIDRASTGYTIPARVAGSIAAIFSVHGLPLPPKAELRAKASGKNPFKVTPKVISTTYGIAGVKASGSAKNIQAVAEFQGQYMVPKNLVTFFSNYVPAAASGDDTVNKFVGDKNNKAVEGIEADLDIQYIMGVAPGVLTDFYEQKGQDFCKDLVAWAQLLLTGDDTPLVNSVSYGWQGPMTQIQCKPAEWKDVDNGFAQLAAKGIAVIFASGDSGSGYQENAADKMGQKLYPSWPASSSWVTSVGATRFVDQNPSSGEMASDQFGSGGGFSGMIDRTNATWQEDVVKSYLSTATKLPKAKDFVATGRGTPDVSGLGEGYQVIDHGKKPDSVGGTSASTPMFSGVVSLLNDARMAKGMKPLGFLNPFLYQNKDCFTDITKGTNAIGRDGQPVPEGFAAQRGWDPATGLGTPLFAKLLAAATGGPSPPPGPPSPPSPPPSPSPPSPPPSPGPSPPGKSHYEDPNAGPCLEGEEAIQITGIQGSFCSPKCEIFRICSKDVPEGTTAEPKCVLETQGSQKPTQCALICTPSGDAGQCPDKASCKAISGTGLCTYDN